MTSAFAILAGLLAVAAASDIAQRRVPNALVALLAAGGVAVQAAAGGGWAVGRGLLGGGLVLVGLLYPYMNGKLGAGDVKLAAAAAVWVGPGRVFEFLLVAGAAGLPVAIGARIAHRLRERRLLAHIEAGGAMLEQVVRSRETVPLAVAIAIGALFVARGGIP